MRDIEYPHAFEEARHHQILRLFRIAAHPRGPPSPAVSIDPKAFPLQVALDEHIMDLGRAVEDLDARGRTLIPTALSLDLFGPTL